MKKFFLLLALIATTSAASYAQNQTNTCQSCAVSQPIFDEQPSFPGGEQALLVAVMQNIKYPTEAVDKKIQGTVIISFIVTKKGVAKNFKVDKSLHPSLDAEAIRAAQQAMKGKIWKPAKLKGKPMNCTFRLPVRFALQ